MSPQAIAGVSSTEVVGRLDAFHEWFWPAASRAEAPPAAASDVPPLLHWALAHADGPFQHRFMNDRESCSRTRCFDECGGAFTGYIDPRSDNPLVSFELNHHPVDQPPLLLNDLVIGAYVEGLAWFALDSETSTISTEPIDAQHQLWSGPFLYGAEGLRLGMSGEQVQVQCPPVFDGTYTMQRPRLDPTKPIRELTLRLPGASVPTSVHLVEGADLTIPTYRHREFGSIPPTEALVYADIRTLGTDEYEPASETTISWNELAPYWETITANAHDQGDHVEGTPITVLREEADIWQQSHCTDLNAVERLGRLISQRSLPMD